MKKKLGPGSLALLLSALALIWCWSPRGSAFCLGDHALSLLGLPAWSSGETGIHYALWYSLVFLIPAFILGRRYGRDRFAAAGKWISGITSAVLILLAPCLILAM